MPVKRRRYRQWVLWGVLAGLSGCATGNRPADGGPDVAFLREQGIQYWLVVKEEPRPLRFHNLKVDLHHPRLELTTVVPEDPDGDGPAEVALAAPLALAERARSQALVNCNPWQTLPDAEGKRSDKYAVGMPSDILGLAVSQGRVRSESVDWAKAFWLDFQGRPHTGIPQSTDGIREGVAGFGAVLKEGQVVVGAGADEPKHPRTALGLDASGRWLFLVVVDGRQPGYSEGVTTYELALYLKALGCSDALNLDGGGSSVMILADRDGRQRVVNDPSTKFAGLSVTRPLPNALVLRRK